MALPGNFKWQRASATDPHEEPPRLAIAVCMLLGLRRADHH